MYAETTKIAEKDLVVTHPIHVDLDEACKMARVAFVVEAIQLVSREQIQERIVEEIIEVPVSRVMEKIIML